MLADVVLLATCFHAFRRNIYKMHTTDPAYFLGLPGLSWSLAMKHLPKGNGKVIPIELLEKPNITLNSKTIFKEVLHRYSKDMPRGSMRTKTEPLKTESPKTPYHR